MSLNLHVIQYHKMELFNGPKNEKKKPNLKSRGGGMEGWEHFDGLITAKILV